MTRRPTYDDYDPPSPAVGQLLAVLVVVAVLACFMLVVLPV